MVENNNKKIKRLAMIELKIYEDYSYDIDIKAAKEYDENGFEWDDIEAIWGGKMPTVEPTTIMRPLTSKNSQILDVIQLVITKLEDVCIVDLDVARVDEEVLVATKALSVINSVEKSTILDKYTRKIGLTKQKFVQHLYDLIVWSKNANGATLDYSKSALFAVLYGKSSANDRKVLLANFVKAVTEDYDY